MRIQQFIVDLDNQNAVYRPGDEIRGRVILRLAKSIRIRGLRLNIVGESFSRWEFGKKSTTNTSSSYIYKSYEKYIDYKQTLLGKEEHDSKAKNVGLQKGDHVFEFSYRLPVSEDGGVDLPTSIEGAYGYVRYCIRVVVDRPMKRNQWTLKPITVLKTMDLNQEPTAQETPKVCNTSKVRSKSCVCRTGAHNLSLDLERTGFCPGESIVVNAKCENGTSRKILRTSVDLLQVINYLGNKKPLIGSVQSKTRRTMKVVQSVRGEGCGGHSIVHWNNVPLIVPPVPPSRLDGCNIIDVQYLIRFTAYLKNGKRLFCETGVLVGTEPLTSSYAAYYGEGISCVVDRSTSIPAELNAKSQQGGETEEENGTEPKQYVQTGTEAKVETADDQFFPVYTNVACPPASFEECVYGGATLTNDEYTMGQTVFVPLYRVYHTLRHQSIAIQAYGRASIVIEDMSPYKPIGVPVSVQVSEVHLPTVGIQEEDEEYFDDDHSDPLAYRESTGENEDSEITSSPLPNGEYIPERPLEPIMFEVHHSGESQYASAAESPQMQVYPANGTENDHFVAPNAKVLNGVEYHQESSIDTPVREDDNNSYPATAIVSIENENAAEYSDSEAEQEPEPVAVPPESVSDDVGREEVFLENHVAPVQEPEEPRPLFSTEQVLIAYEKEPYSVEEDIPEIEEVENVAEEMKVQESCPEPPVLAPPEIEESLVPSEPKENESAQSVELDSNGLPIGAMIPLTNSNESFNSDNTTDDQPASEVFQEEPIPVAPIMYTYNQQIESPVTQESKVTIENVRIIQNASMMETLEIITTDVGTELNSEPYINGEGDSYEPTLQIAPRDYQHPSQESGRYSESDAAMYEDFRADDIEAQHDRLPNGTASNTLEELSVDTNAPTVDLDSTEAEYHSGSSNCAEFMVNSLTPDYYLVDNDNANNSALTPDLPSPSFPEPIEENEPCEEPVEASFEEPEQEEEPEETQVDDEDESYAASDKDEVTEVYQPKEEKDEEEDLEKSAEVERQSSSGSSSLVEPLNYVETAENIAEAAIREATVQISKDEVVRTSVHFNVEEEPNTGTDSPSIAPEKLLYVDDVNTTESSDKTSYDNVQFDDLLDYEENTRSDQVEDLNSSPTENGTLESTELSPPPLVHLDSVTNDYENEQEPEKVDLGVFLPPPPEPPVQHHEPQFQEVIANISLEPSMNPSQQQFAQIPSDQLYNVPTQSTVESSSEDEDDEEGLSAIEEEPSLTTQDGEESTPPPIPDRSLIPDFPAPPIPLRAPAPEPESYLPDPTYSGTVDDYLANKFQDDPFPVPIMEPLSPITEKTFDGETTADEASPSVFSDNNTSKQFDLMMSDCGSYDVNESDPGMPVPSEVNQTFNDTFPEIDDDDAAEDMQKHEYSLQSDDHSNENLESLVPPEREPITPEDDIYISYGPGVSGTLVSEHAENDDYDIDDLIGPGPESVPPPIDRSQKPTDQSPSHDSGSSPFHAQNEER
ncbi:uncharacterized protein LOC142334975 isoform X2 [Convolutriloba macropyga]|uniref:uncharacterized protein LOC142334975 isoform X2 n=1 Tax=Convolutriloba macropyga TaxID=536237 RepID=UPI003F5286CA